MTARDLLTLALRVMGFWVIIRALGLLDYACLVVFSVFDTPEVPAGVSYATDAPLYMIVTALADPVITGCLGILLLLFAPRMSARFYPTTAASSSDTNVVAWKVADVYRVGVQLMGIYALLLAIPLLVRDTSWLFSRDRLEPVTAHGISGMITGGLYLACSVVLVYGSRNVAEWLSSVRHVPETPGIEEPQSADVPPRPDG